MFKQILKNIILALVVSMGVISTCSALEVDYPAFGSFAAPTTTTTLLPYVSYVFGFAIFIAGLIVFGAMIYGGMKYLTSAGNVGASSDAKDRIFSAIIGLAILLLSFLGLSLINVSITKIELAPIQKEGVIITFADGSSKVYPSFANSFPGEVKKIEFDEKKYKVYFYFQEGMVGQRNTASNGVVNDNPKSMKIVYTEDGVQLCYPATLPGGGIDEVCQVTSQSSPGFGELDDKFDQLIITDKKDSTGKVILKYWAVVFDKQSYGFGEIRTYTGEGIKNLNLNLDSPNENVSPWASSIKIFSYNPENKDSGLVKIYKQINFAGEPDVANGGTIDNWNDMPKTKNENRSIEMTVNKKAILCEKENGRGRCQLLEKTLSDLTSYEIGRCRVGLDFWTKNPCANSFKVIRGDN